MYVIYTLYIVYTQFENSMVQAWWIIWLLWTC